MDRDTLHVFIIDITCITLNKGKPAFNVFILTSRPSIMCQRQIYLSRNVYNVLPEHRSYVYPEAKTIPRKSDHYSLRHFLFYLEINIRKAKGEKKENKRKLCVIRHASCVILTHTTHACMDRLAKANFSALLGILTASAHQMLAEGDASLEIYIYIIRARRAEISSLFFRRCMSNLILRNYRYESEKNTFFFASVERSVRMLTI